MTAEAMEIDAPEGKRAVLVDEADFPMRAVTVPLPAALGMGEGHLHFNPLTSFIGLTVLMLLVIWCAVDEEGALEELLTLKAKVSMYWTWFYIGTQAFWVAFIAYIGYYYGHIKLGGPDEKPEYDDTSYFVMLFAAGVAIGLFFYGVSEPLLHADNYHATSQWANRYTAAGYHTMNEVDLYALTLTLYHWGVAAWAPYLLVAISASLGTYNFGLPMTMRSSLYPVLGELTWGWMGDFVDGFTIITVVSGVCTSLGLGAMQMVTGLRMLDWISETSDPDDNDAEVIAIWCVTALATISVVSGLDVGIKILSYVAFLMGCSLWFLVLIMDRTSFLLNLMVEGTGTYFAWMPIMTFATDSFDSLRTGEGVDPEGFEAVDTWMNGWTVFYMAWWTAWASFVGLFIARISRGRTIGSMIVFVLGGPLAYVILWFSVFCGAGLRQARVAAELIAHGTTQGDADMYLDAGSVNCYTAPDSISWTDGTTTINWEYRMKGVNPNCILNASDTDTAWFNLLNSFHGCGDFLSGLSLFTIAIYFITSSDSGSMVVDQLASNGRFDHHWLQRVLWAAVEGSVATGLIASGGSESLKALQAGSIIAGLPFTAILMYCCYSVVRFCDCINTKGRTTSATGEVSATLHKTQFHRFAIFEGPKSSDFKIPLWGGVFNYLEYAFSGGVINPKLIDYTPLPTKEVLVALGKGFLPGWSFFEISSKQSNNKTPLLTGLQTAIATLSFLAWIICWSIPESKEEGMFAFGWFFYIIMSVMIALLRMDVRARYNIDGSLLWDVWACLMMWPQVLCQMEMQFALAPDKVEDAAYVGVKEDERMEGAL
jgi:choline-glycine betaine transporter